MGYGGFVHALLTLATARAVRACTVWASLVDLRWPLGAANLGLTIGWQNGAKAGANLPNGGGMNHLYYGDNLKVLRESIRDESVQAAFSDVMRSGNAAALQL